MVPGGPQHTLRKGQHGSGRAGVSGGTGVELSEVQGSFPGTLEYLFPEGSVGSPGAVELNVDSEESDLCLIFDFTRR